MNYERAAREVDCLLRTHAFRRATFVEKAGTLADWMHAGYKVNVKSLKRWNDILKSDIIIRHAESSKFCAMKLKKIRKIGFQKRIATSYEKPQIFFALCSEMILYQLKRNEDLKEGYKLLLIQGNHFLPGIIHIDTETSACDKK